MEGIWMEKPILFNIEMVKAILEGKKTVTRRVIKPQPIQQIPLGFVTSSTDKKHEDCFGWGMSEHGGVVDYAKLPYKIGDILYVRETWGIHSMKNYGKRVKFLFKAEAIKELREVALSESRYDDMLKYSFKNGWQPSLFMPKEAARIFLEVTNVRVERLQDITEDQAINEGCKGERCEHPNYNSEMGCCTDCYNTGYLEPPQLEFSYLWNSTLKKEQLELYSWDNNPWVWVIEFKKLENKKD